jgi:hypothetical protein
MSCVAMGGGPSRVALRCDCVTSIEVTAFDAAHLVARVVAA